MKTCSDALKALFNQYRTGEKRTWYIADLYTVWLNSSERIDEIMNRDYSGISINSKKMSRKIIKKSALSRHKEQGGLII